MTAPLPPPAPAGNLRAVRHGAHSPAIVEPVAQELATRIVEAAAYLAEPRFQPSVEAWSRAEAKCALLNAYLEDHGHLDRHGRPRPAFRLLREWERRASEERDRLGLSPVAAAKLSKDITATQFDLARAMAELGDEPSSTVEAEPDA